MLRLFNIIGNNLKFNRKAALLHIIYDRFQFAGNQKQTSLLRNHGAIRSTCCNRSTKIILKIKCKNPEILYTKRRSALSKKNSGERTRSLRNSHSEKFQTVNDFSASSTLSKVSKMVISFVIISRL